MTLRLSVGQHSEAGRKPLNQDFHGVAQPTDAQRRSRGIALAIADGISSSAVSQVASAAAVRGFLEDYYGTSEAWTVGRAAQCVLAATNAWLHAQTQRGDGRFDKDRGHVCSFSALVFKGREVHLLHVGDTRAYRLHPGALEQLSQDHRVRVDGQTYLGRALGVSPHLEIDHACWPAEVGETFVLATDGAYEHLDAARVHEVLAGSGADLQAASEALVAAALAAGSPDNATVMLARVEALPAALAPAVNRDGLRLPPRLAPRQDFEGYRVVRELHTSARSQVVLAVDAGGREWALKLPSAELATSTRELDRFAIEEWVARRIDSPHVIKAAPADARREHLFSAMEFVQGQTLAQWMTDHPAPGLDEVREIIGQIARGLQALHRKEMLHQDLRPENLIIDRQSTVVLIDLASAHVAGLSEGMGGGLGDAKPRDIAGTLQYTAPEYFSGDGGTPLSELFSLAVLAYQMLTGALPYGLEVTQVRGPRDLHKLHYVPLRTRRPDLPEWLDRVLRKALQPQPVRRQQALSEFVHDLHAPGPEFTTRDRTPLQQRHPLLFWRGLTLVFGLATVVLLGLRASGR
ncbi:bifunctional protein-serine/threonine kinase/phosphatase [Roseateles saccharophilus]|uniref:Serine/threonine protein kinase n=1 Tax=Roseateles saccharophilus TaxID=304 RepID=A0A4R3V874_ROSSA|nr:bifunctional protein-serine/threonine kinase/phosphatase [Roseateles saccharophilus]MDG0831502.1 bifunctional protein-serine/threonine kinase/phosphatase [Roseateles saccharophilus]TCU98614.1 serine/threonine protein kinase [Roseateles saccharophilus]